jgi:hypothetical protein
MRSTTITVEHPFRTEIRGKKVRQLSPMAVANVANGSSKYLI